MEAVKNILKEQKIEADDSMVTAIREQFDKGFTVLFHHQVLTDNKAVYLIFSRESDNKTYRAFKYIQNNSLIRKADMDLSKINFNFSELFTSTSNSSQYEISLETSG